MRSTALSLLCAIALTAHAAGPAPAKADVQAQQNTSQSAQAFVQGFYDWYSEQMQKHDDRWSYDSALRNERWPFSEKFVGAFTAYLNAPSNSPDEVGGLDFDPFLNAQDLCFPYKAGKVTKAGNRYQVEVLDSNCNDPHPESPILIAELERRNGAWVFTNFIYPEAKTDLLTLLKGFKEEREKKPN